MEGLVVLLVILFASVPMISATDEAAITRDDCDEFVHRIFNMVRSVCVILARSWGPALYTDLSLLMRPDSRIHGYRWDTW